MTGFTGSNATTRATGTCPMFAIITFRLQQLENWTTREISRPSSQPCTNTPSFLAPPVGFHLRLTTAQPPQLSPINNDQTKWGDNLDPQIDIQQLEKALQAYYGPGFTIHLPHLRSRREVKSSSGDAAPEDLMDPQADVQLYAAAALAPPRPRNSGHATSKPKPLSILMNFGLDGVSQWSDPDDDHQDDCPAGTIFDPHGMVCREAVCVPLPPILPAKPNPDEPLCSRTRTNRTINIPTNANSSTIFMSLGLHDETHKNRTYTAALHNCCLEQRLEAKLQETVAQVLKINIMQIRNITVPNFIQYPERPQTSERKDFHSSRIESDDIDSFPHERKLSVSEIDRVEVSFVLHRVIVNGQNRNDSDSVVEMYSKLAKEVVDEKSFLFKVDDVEWEVFGIWEEFSNGEKDLSNISWCKRGVVNVLCNDAFHASLNSTNSSILVVATNKTYELGQFKLQIFLKNVQGVPYIMQVAMVCDVPPACPNNAPRFYAGSSATRHPNMSLEYNNMLYDVSEYQYDMVAEKFTLCGNVRVRKEGNSVMGFNMRDDLSYISTSLSILSVIALILTLIIYGIFRDLRTLPGWNLINAMVALVVAQTALLLNSAFKTDEMCCFIGIITHYSYLLGFFFANVIAFDIYCTFGSGRSGTFRIPNGDRRAVRIRVLKNMAYCYLSAGVIVGGAVILDRQNVPKWEVQYQELCWIAGQRASLIFFALPVIVINLVNAVLVGVTFYRIRQHQKRMQGLRVGAATKDGKAAKGEVMSYVRIGSVFGFTWIFGIVAGFVTNQATHDHAMLVFYEVMIYAFIFTQSCQGVLIFLAFGMNSNVRGKIVKLYKQHYVRVCKSCGTKICRCTNGSSLTKSIRADSFN
ncbi:hypothetical protein BV898_08190 [Hypsibius exemplaris]|uniref:G-protein coupled receptors family 2 profile 2 domain-containing protein n=1 Tax=Hypsibius exemplaris TaxID=2072580 RepID=A0A1W0WRF0_HYPEX|nr:hypothetical protein BV898_08190 [Hypsibius exemplaris]